MYCQYIIKLLAYPSISADLQLQQVMPVKIEWRSFTLHERMQSAPNSLDDPYAVPVPPCLEFTEFEKYLNHMRKWDDNLIFMLNKTNGSLGECEKLWKRVSEVQQLRCVYILFSFDFSPERMRLKSVLQSLMN